jgi:hypothetical protein
MTECDHTIIIPDFKRFVKCDQVDVFTGAGVFVNHSNRDARDATSINAILKTKLITIATIPISSTKHSKRKFGDTIDKNATTVRKSVTEIISFFKKSIIFFVSDNVAGICYKVFASW